jgi:4,5-dihydroxyphthalate decarboxylase
MGALRLSASLGYYDRTLPILTGLVQPEGIELALPPIRPGNTMGSPEADLYEMPVPAFIIRRARVDSHVGLPIFPKRTFFQQLLLTRRDAPVERFEDLRGRNVGLMNWYQHTIGVWLRGHLTDAYGIRPEELRWFTQRETAYPLEPSQSVSITVRPESDQVQMLLDGEIDVLLQEQAHRILREQPSLRRVFPDFKERETAYFRATGCFPPNHMLCIRREILEANPWVAGSLLRAYEQARQQAAEIMERNNSHVLTPWMDELLEDQRDRIGDDPYPYGLERNRVPLETLVRYLHNQGLIPRPLPLEAIFAAVD